MEPLFDLEISLPPKGSGELLRSLHRQLRAAIRDGRLQPEQRLPSTRGLAAMLGVSRNTVVAAYDLLLSEGYLQVRTGAGTYVADLVFQLSQRKATASDSSAEARLSEFWRNPHPFLPAAKSDTVRYDFRVGLPDKTSFPFQIWRRLSARALRALSKAPAAYADPQGREALRAAIVRHISYARAVSCPVENLVVTSGAQQAFDLLARVLVTPDQTVVAVEEPGYPPMRAAFAAARARIVPIPVDREGMLVEWLPPETRVICVTPSHQFPLGVAMSAQRRSALLDFAQSRGAVVIEDDYDGEFRFHGRPLDALQTLDRADSVFYVGTFSKCLFPALRLGYVVAPSWARRALVTAKAYTDWHSAVLTQDTLAGFIEEGHLVRHVRKMQKIYAVRRTKLIQALERHCGDRLIPFGADVGLHLAAKLALPIQAGSLVTQAEVGGIWLQALDRYATGQPAPNVVLFGFGMIRSDQIDEAISQLAQLMSAG